MQKVPLETPYSATSTPSQTRTRLSSLATSPASLSVVLRCHPFLYHSSHTNLQNQMILW